MGSVQYFEWCMASIYIPKQSITFTFSNNDPIIMYFCKLVIKFELSNMLHGSYQMSKL